jgi:hypothetical protein
MPKVCPSVLTGNKPYILAFVGENANGILDWWTRHILEAFEHFGFGHCVVDMLHPDWRTALSDALAAGKPEFCFSFQGIGMNLQIEGQNYWSQNQIPFFSYLGDSPYHAPNLHAAQGPGLQLLYSCLDFLQTYRAMGGPLYATTLRYGYPRNPHADVTPWRARGHQIVYVKTGVDSARLRAEWRHLPRSITHVLEHCTQATLNGATTTISATCAAAFEADDIHCGVHDEFFLSVCSKVDFYVRAVRAERMVRGLMKQNATIIGDWSHLNQAGARARFVPPVAAGALDALYADAQIVVNTSPSVRFGMHERIMAGLFAKAAVVSDTTPFLTGLLAGCPSFMEVGLDEAGFEAQLDETLSGALADPDMPTKVAVSADFARQEFGLDRFAAALLEQVGLEQYRRQVEGWWSFPPRTHARNLPAISG